MSQITNSSSSGSTPPEVALQYTTDVNGPAIPSGNNLNVFGLTLEDNVENGILTNGQSDILYVALTNRIVGSVTTVGNTTETLATFNCGIVGVATPGAFKFKFEVIGFNNSTPAAAGYAIDASARTNGTTATIVETPDADEDEDPILQAQADWDVTSSGNNVLLSVTGVTGLTINWKVVGYYVFVGV